MVTLTLGKFLHIHKETSALPTYATSPGWIIHHICLFSHANLASRGYNLREFVFPLLRGLILLSLGHMCRHISGSREMKATKTGIHPWHIWKVHNLCYSVSCHVHMLSLQNASLSHRLTFYDHLSDLTSCRSWLRQGTPQFIFFKTHPEGFVLTGLRLRLWDKHDPRFYRDYFTGRLHTEMSSYLV